MRIENGGFLSIEQVQNKYLGQTEKIRGGAGVQNSEFGKILSQIEENREGVCNLIADKNVNVSEEDIVWLLKKYL